MIKLPENLPDYKSFTREEAIRLLCTCEYGFIPKHPEKITFTEESVRENYAAGKAVLRRMTALVEENGKTFSFPFWFAAPKLDTPAPAVVHINFRGNLPDDYLPAEELIDLGIAFAMFDYQAVAPDNNDFESLAGGFLGVDRSEPYAPGKIAIWAWAARIVMDYVETRPEVDLKNVAVAGHSRLGKTALYTGLFDERFSFVWSNDSGCSGAALFRDKVGEDAERIHKQFPYWFCPNFEKYAAGKEELPFDQHFLLSLIAPRHLYVCSAIEDTWADPQAELAACVAATPAYEACGLTGLIGDPDSSFAGLTLLEGHIGYHCRGGTHYLSREDWQKAIAFIKKHLN